MKNPFINQKASDALWVGTLLTGLISAGTLTLIFIAKYAAEKKQKASEEKFKHEHAGDYLKPKAAKKQRSDIHDLERLTSAHD